MDGCKINAIEQGAADTGKSNSTPLKINWAYPYSGKTEDIIVGGC